ncbi:MAG: hypothetical protein CYPHOPRED_005821 [Cyphobasidiales sp. Tagirdzhanova-0007]|nr:MAG: hypothetical protein CYPHOPRED_005821 [Cyphobasidiales sp. Tagirdzhanova-0007]
MAALALRHPAATSPLTAALLLLHQGVRSICQSPSSILDLFPPFLLAVPKSKVSHSRKSMRSANKGLKEKLNIVTCHGCGRAKTAHHICSHCYSEISRGFKTAARQQSRPSTSDSSPERPRMKVPSLGATRWAKERGGATPVQPGQVLTKWMRARAGFSKADPKVTLGSEHKVIRSKIKKEQETTQSMKD